MEEWVGRTEPFAILQGIAHRRTEVVPTNPGAADGERALVVGHLSLAVEAGSAAVNARRSGQPDSASLEDMTVRYGIWRKAIRAGKAPWFTVSPTAA